MKKALILLSILLIFTQCKTMEKRTISVRANIMYKTLKKYSIKKIVFKTVLNKPQKFKSKKVLDRINRKLQTKEINIEGFRVITVSTSNPSNKHIIFFHGGGYVAEAMKGQIVIMEKLVELYNFKVTFIDYPLAPEYTAVTTHKISAAAYSKIREDYPDDIFFFLGDSAGGGLALAFLQTLRDSSSIYMPTKTVLLSPWLDISMSNPGIDEIESRDVFLQKDGLQKMGKIYAGELEINNPVVSPIFGNMNNLNSIKVFVSNDEIFYSDCILLKTKIESATGTTIEFKSKDKMIHDWAVLPIKERYETLKDIADFLNEK